MLQNPKMMARKKAMDALMKEGPMLKIEIKKKGAAMGRAMGMGKEPDMADPMEEMEGEKDDAGEKGFEQMLVSPEEKEMIMEMRKEKKGHYGAHDMMDDESGE